MNSLVEIGINIGIDHKGNADKGRKQGHKNIATHYRIEQIRVKARNLFCYWANRELGATMTELARLLNISQPSVSICGQAW
jgi:hypothetical protein